MDPKDPETPLDPVARRPRQFKMRLTEDEANQLKTTAHKHELTQADYVRKVVFGNTAHGLPNATKLQDIAAKLAGIGNNINQAMAAVKTAQKDGTLNADQFDAMYKIIAEARRIWLEPLGELRGQLGKLK